MRTSQLYMAFLTLLSLSTSYAQPLDEAYVDKVVSEIARIYETQYTFPEKGMEVSNDLKKRLANGEFDDIATYELLASTLKDRIFTITKDKHAAVIARKPPEPREEAAPQPSINSFLSQLENFGFTEVKIINKEIGYVKMPVFFPVQMDEKALDAADEVMEKFRNCSAVIFDLTSCGGGDPNMISHLITYLFPAGEPVHLNDFYYRPTEATSSSYTKDGVKGERLDKAAVYVLTSSKTFSAAEEFAYDLKHLRRATLIGETTGGGAHTVEPRILDEHIELMMPTGRAINPITKTNWEGTGVVPHVEVPADNALEKALSMIESKY